MLKSYPTEIDEKYKLSILKEDFEVELERLRSSELNIGLTNTHPEFLRFCREDSTPKLQDKVRNYLMAKYNMYKENGSYNLYENDN